MCLAHMHIQYPSLMVDCKEIKYTTTYSRLVNKSRQGYMGEGVRFASSCILSSSNRSMVPMHIGYQGRKNYRHLIITGFSTVSFTPPLKPWWTDLHIRNKLAEPFILLADLESKLPRMTHNQYRYLKTVKKIRDVLIEGGKKGLLDKFSCLLSDQEIKIKFLKQRGGMIIDENVNPCLISIFQKNL